MREFRKYAGYLAWKYGDLVDLWVPLNEPVVVATSGYVNVPGALAGYFPPGAYSFPGRRGDGEKPGAGAGCGLRRDPPPRPAGQGRPGAQHDRLHPLRPGLGGRPARGPPRQLHLQPHLPRRRGARHRRPQREREDRARRAQPPAQGQRRLRRAQLLLPRPGVGAARPGQQHDSAVRLLAHLLLPDAREPRGRSLPDHLHRLRLGDLPEGLPPGAGDRRELPATRLRHRERPGRRR